MNRGSLSQRLQYLREGKSWKSRRGTGEKNGSRLLSPGGGWKKEDDFVFSRVQVTDSPFQSSFSHFPGLSLLLKHRELDLKDLLFYDLETTGLSGGAGVIAFLAGFGRIEKNKLSINQYFLSDFPGEYSFIKNILKELRPDTVLVSYNGKTFDHHLLQVRSLMNGLSFPEVQEIDLLYPSRRLWKEHLPDCTLSSIEKYVLGIQRTGDVPGRYIPDLYFSFLKSGKVQSLKGVFYHHLQDIRSLAFLLQHISQLWRNPEKCWKDECYSLGKYLLSEGREEGEQLLKKVWERKGSFSGKAGMLLSLHYKKSGRIKDAVSIWEKMWRINPGYSHGIELAKFYEHKLKSYKRALEITEYLYTKSSAFFSENIKAKICYRIERLKKRIDQEDRY